MRLPALLLLAGLAWGAEDEDAARAALAALARGDAAPLAALPLDAAIPPDLPDPLQPGLRRRWSRWLPGLVAALSPETRSGVLAVLERRCRDDAAALDALPAPLAVRRLLAAADRAFDHGRFAAALAIWRALEHAGAPIPAERVALAGRLGGDGAEVADDLVLAAPGGVAPLAAAVPPPPVDGPHPVGPWLVRDDPWGRRLWRRAVDGPDAVLGGGGWALLQGPAGLRSVDPDGILHLLPPPPAGTRAAALGGGGAWFLRDPPPGDRDREAGTPPRAWRYALAGGGAEEAVLAEDPLGPPLVRGRRSLWLGRLRLWLAEPGQPPAWCWHGLELEAGAHLAWSGRVPAVRAGGAAWRVLAGPAAPGQARPAGAWLVQRRAAPPAAGLRAAAARDDLWLTVEAADGAGWRWRRRWAARDAGAAPAQLALPADDAVTVLEGAGDLTTLAAADGALRGWGLITGGAVDPELALAWGPGRAAAAQLGRRDRLLVAVDGAQRCIALPAPLRGLRQREGRLEADLGAGWRPVE